ncbi:hypothetical protein [Endozoicomonas atrinae]|uniref:hypothetical protein n=1 Tax=Endozoicomonas atrinae TaxID=1333660 RepID=UPI003AFF70C0
MKYLSLTLATFAFIALFTTASAEARQRIPEANASQAKANKQASSKQTPEDTSVLPVTAKDREALTGLLEGIFNSVREQDYSKLASFYSEEARTNFKYRFLKRDKINKFQQAIPEVAGRLEALPPADFIATVYTHMFDKLTLSLGMPINIAYPNITNIELSNNGKEAILTYVELDSNTTDPDDISEETMEFVNIAGEWRPLGWFLEDTLDELMNILLLAQTFAETSQAAAK